MATPTDHDERWDQLALGHVLGGLAPEDASSFRGHLAGCGLCRTRVAELRSLDSALAAAEREERAVQRLRLRAAEEAEETADPRDLSPPMTPRPRWSLVLFIALGAVLLLVVLLWNAHLRTENVELHRATTLQEQTLGALGSGTVVPVNSSGSVTGVVSVDGDRIAWVLDGLPIPDTGERMVIWVVVDGTPRPVASHTPSQLEQRRIASTVAAPGATRLLVTIEPLIIPEAPSSHLVLDARLDSDVSG